MSAELREALAFWDKLDKFGLPESRIGVIVEAARRVAEADERVWLCWVWGEVVRTEHPYCGVMDDATHREMHKDCGWRLLLPAEEEK